jgi:predicted transposase YdaD
MGDHDGLFKRVFSVPAHAASELRSILPASVIDQLDLDALTLSPSSFVDPEMSASHVDLLFRAPRRGRPEAAPVYLYFLVEHQSQPDRWMPWRMLTYVQRIWEAVLREQPSLQSLPPVVTIVVHHGDRGWSAPRRLHELIDGLDELPELARFVPEVELIIDDLAAVSDDSLRQRPLPPFPKVALWVLRDGRDSGALGAHLDAWADEVRALAATASRSDIDVIVRYILRVAGDASFRQLRQRIIDIAPPLEEPMATMEEHLIQRGMQRGLEQGLQRGREEGREEGLRAGLEQLLRLRFGELSPEAVARLEAAGAPTLLRWIERAVAATTLDDVLRDA